jgi:Chlorophyll A-B binding protein
LNKDSREDTVRLLSFGCREEPIGHVNNTIPLTNNTTHLDAMKTAVLATLIASAAAFAPAKQAVTSSALNAFESELGAQPPLGFFDPLGLVADGDQAKFDRLRLVEIKHGRIAMLGVVGYLVTYAGTWELRYCILRCRRCANYCCAHVLPSLGHKQASASQVPRIFLLDSPHLTRSLSLFGLRSFSPSC